MKKAYKHKKTKGGAPFPYLEKFGCNHDVKYMRIEKYEQNTPLHGLLSYA